jgi:hypothetical protein
MNNYNNKIYIKMFFYFIVTTIITFSAVLDTLDTDSINNITTFAWIKLILKSIVPSLITIKAFIDPSVNEILNQTDASNTNK